MSLISNWLMLIQYTGVAFLQGIISPIFWLLVLLIALQYRRLAATKRQLFGINDEPVWQHVLLAAGYGIAGGFIGSLVMVLVGISLNDIGLVYLWVVALVLMLFSPRFICFSYAGGLIALSSLLFGFPRVQVPQLMGLVGALHLVESLLILFSGHLGALPVYTRDSRQRTVGAFSLQKMWPIPIVALIVMPGQVSGGVPMPDWWPLIRPAGMGTGDEAVFGLVPVLAALGYGDLALTSLPQQKSRVSARNLAGFSSIQLGLAVLASRYPAFSYLAAAFGPLGHELTIMQGQRYERRGEPVFVPDPEGVKVLDVLRSSPAGRVGLASGDVILRVNGRPTRSRQELAAALEDIPWQVEIEFRDVQGKQHTALITKPAAAPLGALPVPEPGDPPQVEFGTGGWLARLLARWRMRGGK